MRIPQVLGNLVLTLALLAPVSGQYPPGQYPGSSNPGPSGPPSTPSGAAPVMGPGRAEEGAVAPGTAETEEPVGNIHDWLTQNPKSPLVALVEQKKGSDQGLLRVLNALTPSELTDLGFLLTIYQTHINNHVAKNPRVWDTGPGSMRNLLNHFNGDTFARGCADMAEQAAVCLGGHTGGTRPFTAHEYNWAPGLTRQVGVLAGLPLAAAAVGYGVGIAKFGAAGAAVGGPLGLVVGGGAGIVIAFSTGNTQHNMAAIRSTRDPNLMIVLDPHATQNGDPESVHGPDYYSGWTTQPELGPPRTPATPPTQTPATPATEEANPGREP